MEDIRCEGIFKSFGGEAVFEDFSACFPAGRLSVIMGESGCGKTTLLNMLMGFEKPDRGKVLGVPEKKSAVFQEDRLFEAFRPLANLKAVLGKRFSDGRLKEELLKLGIGDGDLMKPVSDFSGGMKRRLAIARAVLYGGEALFLDEPFKGLDADTKKTAMDYVKENTGERTVILVTHDQAEADALQTGSRVLLTKRKERAPICSPMCCRKISG